MVADSPAWRADLGGYQREGQNGGEQLGVKPYEQPGHLDLSGRGLTWQKQWILVCSSCAMLHRPVAASVPEFDSVASNGAISCASLEIPLHWFSWSSCLRSARQLVPSLRRRRGGKGRPKGLERHRNRRYGHQTGCGRWPDPKRDRRLVGPCRICRRYGDQPRQWQHGERYRRHSALCGVWILASTA